MAYKEITKTITRRRVIMYLFSPYLICSRFCDVGILLVVLVSVSWVCLEKMTCFVDEGSIQGKRLEKGFYQEASVSSDSVQMNDVVGTKIKTPHIRMSV